MTNSGERQWHRNFFPHFILYLYLQAISMDDRDPGEGSAFREGSMWGV